MNIPKKNIEEAVKEALRLSKKRKFKQSVELIVTFSDVINPKSPEAKFRDTIILPKGLGKKRAICLVADGDMLLKAKELDFNIIISKDDLTKISRKDAKKIASKCDWVLVKADLMPLAGRILGPALGPRGKIPIAISPTADLNTVLKMYRTATFLRNKEQAFVSGIIGSEDMDIADLVENIVTVLSFIEGKIKRPIESVCKIYIKTTMGPPVEVKIK